MYVCMYVCMCMHVSMYAYACIYVCMYVSMYAGGKVYAEAKIQEADFSNGNYNGKVNQAGHIVL
jgi:hypothetical protein